MSSQLIRREPKRSRRVCFPNSLRTSQMRTTLSLKWGRILRLRGSWEEAEDAYAEALLIARTGRSVGDPVRVAAARSMADFYVDRGRPDEAERIWREEEGTATAAREPQRREAVEIPKPR